MWAAAADPVGVPDIEVETWRGHLPHLPYYLPGRYGDDRKGPPVRVLWPAPVDNSAALAVGTYTVAGAVPGTELPHVFNGDELRELMTGQGSTGARDKIGFTGRLMMRGGALLGITRDASRIQRMSHLWMPVGRRVAVVGGGLVGLELAEFLLERGRRVTVIEESGKFGAELSVVRRWRVLHGLRQHGAVLVNNSRLLSTA